jgi:hypothetical protein
MAIAGPSHPAEGNNWRGAIVMLKKYRVTRKYECTLSIVVDGEDAEDASEKAAEELDEEFLLNAKIQPIVQEEVEEVEEVQQ